MAIIKTNNAASKGSVGIDTPISKSKLDKFTARGVKNDINISTKSALVKYNKPTNKRAGNMLRKKNSEAMKIEFKITNAIEIAIAIH
ncbi:MAG: hypothetical protein AUJ98_00600 [Bacteroidetes bacterium CG2_30_33_31]|nr:MAG: hypothetical protein AUJ98_00600 [Bacteroidetes bacterium CG2_30_33_31]